MKTTFEINAYRGKTHPTVIPAKAGIQLVIKLRAAYKTVFGVLSRYAGELSNYLDSGLRRNECAREGAISARCKSVSGKAKPP